MAQNALQMPVEVLGNERPHRLLDHEWLVTNGLGGYASGTLAGPSTRRYHGLLIAALAEPAGRWMMLNHLVEQLRLPDRTTVELGSELRAGAAASLHGAEHLHEFRLEAGLPVWTYRFKDVEFERRVCMAHMQNTVFISYRLLWGLGPLRLKLRPTVHFRPHDAPVSASLPAPYKFVAVGDRHEISAGPEDPTLRLYLYGRSSGFTVDGRVLPDVLYRVEESRGHEYKGNLWSPGHFRVDLSADMQSTLVASTEQWPIILALKPEQAFEGEKARRRRLLESAQPSAQQGLAAELVMSADQFIIKPAGRLEDAARVQAAGDELRSVIAGYHWFTDWGRDTMIGLEGLTLVTGRHVEASYILRTFSHYIRDGLIPNLFPEGRKQGLYHTADATLWYFHALARYVQTTGDRETLQLLLPRLENVIQHHLRGTHFGIKVDPTDGLLRQGEEGYQLTWMDAKVGDWVVTPRRGKAVEINALWYNALRLMEGWLREERGAATSATMAHRAELARKSFNTRFWYEKGGYLYDVVDGEQGDDPSFRPNQVFAISLPHPILEERYWKPVIEVVADRLLTPVGLRTLAPGSSEYKSKYDGDLRARDAAYHQGTVWPWLIGPFIDAWLRVHPGKRSRARQFLGGFIQHLGEACVGTISEVFDAEEPFTPRGCAAQAWSVAEVLRALVLTEDDAPSGKADTRDSAITDSND
jgi:predicted glycogen debranching enzyme